MGYHKVYVQRVDHMAGQYAGYITEMTDTLCKELEINPEWMEQIAITDELVLMCNREGAVMGLPLNRALYDSEGKMITVTGGNLFIIRKNSGRVGDVTLEDADLIESRLRAVLRISHGRVFTKAFSELPVYRNTHN